MDDNTLRELAARSAEGDLDALENLIRGFHGHLFSFLHLLRVPPGEMEDVAQDVVVRMYRSLGDYRTEQPFLPFLRGIARHAVADLWRSRAREGRRVSAFQAFVEEHVASDPGARHLDIRADRLRQCLDRLPAKHREIVVLRYERGLESAAIAREVSQSAVAVRQALSRIRRTLRACVQASGT
jgi:RNA polymerase sigma-70 factor (ECF subfamily)